MDLNFPRRVWCTAHNCSLSHCSICIICQILISLFYGLSFSSNCSEFWIISRYIRNVEGWDCSGRFGGRGAPTPKMGAGNYYFGQIFRKTAWKWRKIVPRGGASLAHLGSDYGEWHPPKKFLAADHKIEIEISLHQKSRRMEWIIRLNLFTLDISCQQIQFEQSFNTNDSRINGYQHYDCK